MYAMLAKMIHDFVTAWRTVTILQFGLIPKYDQYSRKNFWRKRCKAIHLGSIWMPKFIQISFVLIMKKDRNFCPFSF